MNILPYKDKMLTSQALQSSINENKIGQTDNGRLVVW